MKCCTAFVSAVFLHGVVTVHHYVQHGQAQNVALSGPGSVSPSGLNQILARAGRVGQGTIQQGFEQPQTFGIQQNMSVAGQSHYGNVIENGTLLMHPTFPMQMTSQPTFPMQMTSQPTFPMQKTSQPTFPMQMTSQPIMPMQMTSQPIMPMQMPSQTILPMQMPSQTILPMQMTSQPTFPMQMTSQSTLPMQMTSQSTLPMQMTSQSTLPMQMTSQSTLPMQMTSQSTLPMQMTSQSTLPIQMTSESTFPIQMAMQPEFPNQMTTQSIPVEMINASNVQKKVIYDLQNVTNAAGGLTQQYVQAMTLLGQVPVSQINNLYPLAFEGFPVQVTILSQIPQVVNEEVDFRTFSPVVLSFLYSPQRVQSMEMAQMFSKLSLLNSQNSELSFVVGEESLPSMVDDFNRVGASVNSFVVIMSDEWIHRHLLCRNPIVPCIRIPGTDRIIIRVPIIRDSVAMLMWLNSNVGISIDVGSALLPSKIDVSLGRGDFESRAVHDAFKILRIMSDSQMTNRWPSEMLFGREARLHDALYTFEYLLKNLVVDEKLDTIEGDRLHSVQQLAVAVKNIIRSRKISHSLDLLQQFIRNTMEYNLKNDHSNKVPHIKKKQWESFIEEWHFHPNPEGSTVLRLTTPGTFYGGDNQEKMSDVQRDEMTYDETLGQRKLPSRWIIESFGNLYDVKQAQKLSIGMSPRFSTCDNVTCGLWTLFHTLASALKFREEGYKVKGNTTEGQKSDLITPAELGNTIYNTVVHFFPCERCRKHFIAAVHTCAFTDCAPLSPWFPKNVASIESGEGAEKRSPSLTTDHLIMWLWRLHNGVTVQAATGDTAAAVHHLNVLVRNEGLPQFEGENPAFRNLTNVDLLWPTVEACSDCRREQLRFYVTEQLVEKYLKENNEKSRNDAFDAVLGVFNLGKTFNYILNTYWTPEWNSAEDIKCYTLSELAEQSSGDMIVKGQILSTTRAGITHIEGVHTRFGPIPRSYCIPTHRRESYVHGVPTTVQHLIGRQPVY